MPAVVEASPSLLTISVIYPFTVADEAQQDEAVTHLNNLVPVGDELSVLGGYGPLPGPAVGLRLLLPMPLEFNEQLMLETIAIIDDHEANHAFGKGCPLADFAPKDDAPSA
jgi:hypothetical protein